LPAGIASGSVDSWAKLSRRRYPGRARIGSEIRELIRSVAQNGWGMTVSRYVPRRPTTPDEVKRWVAFLRNHKHDIAAMDLFTVPTASLRLLFGFFVIEHGRRYIVHFNSTFHPTAAWVIQQLREEFPYETAPKYLGFDRELDL
jgi:hypothetical protein